MTLHEKIKELRQMRGLTQTEFSRLIESGQSAVFRFENSEQNLRLNTLRKIAAALDCQLVVDLLPLKKRKVRTKTLGK